MRPPNHIAVMQFVEACYQQALEEDALAALAGIEPHPLGHEKLRELIDGTQIKQAQVSRPQGVDSDTE